MTPEMGVDRWPKVQKGHTHGLLQWTTSPRQLLDQLRLLQQGLLLRQSVARVRPQPESRWTPV